jgi:hypothetical protein
MTGRSGANPKGRNKVKQDAAAVFCVAMNGAQRQRKILPLRPFAPLLPVIVRACQSEPEMGFHTAHQDRQEVVPWEPLHNQIETQSVAGRRHFGAPLPRSGSIEADQEANRQANDGQ